MVIWKAFRSFNVKIKYNSVKYIDVKYCVWFRYKIERRKSQLKDGFACCTAEMKARVSMLLKSRASPDMLPFSLCKKKRLAIQHMNRPVFPTTPSIPSYDIGK
jgi:hypothetical protein